MQSQRNYVLNLGPVPFFVDMSVIFLPVLIFLFYRDATMSIKLINMAVLVFTIVMHELGHALTARARGASGVEITLTGMGGYCSYSASVGSKDKLLISLAGPVMNGLIAVGAWLLFYYQYSVFGDFMETSGGIFLNEILWATLMWNMILGIFNILPIYPLDGGQALYSVFKMQGYSEHRCRKWTLIGSFIGAALAVSVYSLLFGTISMFTGFILIYLLSEAYRHLS